MNTGWSNYSCPILRELSARVAHIFHTGREREFQVLKNWPDKELSADGTRKFGHPVASQIIVCVNCAADLHPGRQGEEDAGDCGR